MCISINVHGWFNFLYGHFISVFFNQHYHGIEIWQIIRIKILESLADTENHSADRLRENQKA